MAPRVHPCVCGFVGETFSKMKHHREKCALWRARPNPLNLMIDRRRTSRRETTGPREFEPCPHCHRRPDHHDSDCPNSQAEAVRRAALKRNKINPQLFEVFLRVLAKKYKDEGLVVVPVWEQQGTRPVREEPEPGLTEPAPPPEHSQPRLKQSAVESQQRPDEEGDGPDEGDPSV